MKNKIYRISSYFLKKFFAYIISKLLFLLPKYRNVWILSERGDDARDNGFFFFEYLCKNKNLENVWYIITKSSPDYSKVARIGNVIQYQSFKHYIFYELAKVRISSSIWGGDLPNSYYAYKTKKFFIEKNKKIVYLKHGIIKDYLPSRLAENVNLDLFICGAEPEYNYILNNYHYVERIVKYTGLARFDNLYNVKTKTKSQILIMPTFRKWLSDVDEYKFKNCQFFQAWDSVLNNKQLIQYLELMSIDLIFYPHYMFQKYLNLFSATSSRIKIASLEDYDVQQLLIDSKLLITDFSSVFFDFGYMHKPILYFQFDRELYIKEHYNFKDGYFDYDVDGFGDVFFDSRTLINNIIECSENNFECKNKFLSRINDFFVMYDNNNCERIYNEILKINK